MTCVLKSKEAILALAATLLVALPAAAPVAARSSDQSEPSKHVIKIGYEIPLSGQSAEPGQCIIDGMNLYLDQIHHEMAGSKVEVIVENSASNPATAIEKVRKLVEQDKVPLLSGEYLTNCLYAIAPVVESYQTPFVVVSSGAADVTQRQRKKWIVRTCYASTQLGLTMGEYASKKLHYKRVVTLGSDYAFGWETVGAFQQAFEQNGGKVVQKLWAPLGFKDFTQIIKSIKTQDVDALYFIGVGQQTEIIHKQLRELGVKLPVIGTTNTFDSSIFPHMGDEILGGVCASLYSTTLDTEANKRFVREFRAKYGSDPGYFSEHGYTAMMFIHKAVEQLKGNIEDKEKTLKALMKVELKDAPRGPVKMDTYGSSVDNVYITRVDRVNGKLQNTVIFTYPMVSQFGRYSPEVFLKQPAFTKDYPPCRFCSQ
jgi:branched-chain amino acid transport system substrate-binding protein